MKNGTIAVLIGWVIMIYLSIMILKNTIYVYNLLFLLILGAVYNVALFAYFFDDKTSSIMFNKKRKLLNK